MAASRWPAGTWAPGVMLVERCWFGLATKRQYEIDRPLPKRRQVVQPLAVPLDRLFHSLDREQAEYGVHIRLGLEHFSSAGWMLARGP